jgi:hypothetical protein
MWRVYFSMATSMKKCMLSNLSVLKITRSPTMCTSWRRHYMAWNKHLEHGMRDWEISCSVKGSSWKRLTPLSSPRRLVKTCLCCKSMLITSYLDQQINTIVMSLGRWWLMSLRCPWLESLVISLVFKSSNWRMEHL